MEANKKYYDHEYRGTSYIEGNTVRKLNSLPDRREKQLERPLPVRREHRQTKTLSGMDITSLIVLTAAIVATLYLCVNYLSVQSQINQLEKEISAKQEQLITLTRNNDAAYEAIDMSYDLEHIYKVAVEELGMVYPKDNKVIKYQGKDNDYVRQYEDIPR